MAARVLVVEDDPEFLQFLQFSLEKAEYLPLPAASAAAAKRWLDDPASRPDAVVLDVGLPDADFDGLDLCQAIKRSPATCRIPVIVVTGRTDNAVRLRAAEAQADLVLDKPLSADELIAALRLALERPVTERRGLLHKGGLEIDPDKRTVFFSGRTLDDLSPRLFDLLYVLVERSPAPVSPREALSALKLVERDREVYVMVSRLRARLRQAFGCDLLATVPRRGYRLEVPVGAERPP